MFHSYFYTPFMDALYAISALSALLRRLQFNAAVCACKAIGKGKTALKKCYLRSKQSWNSLSASIQCQSQGFKYRSNSLSFITRQLRYLRRQCKTVEYYIHLLQETDRNFISEMFFHENNF